MFKIMKVFDCQTMPINIRKIFFDVTDNKDNDCYVEWSFGMELSNEGWCPVCKPTDSVNNCIHVDVSLVDTWLKANGAVDDDDILISHWW